MIHQLDEMYEGDWGDCDLPDRQERAKMPVGCHARSKAASKLTWQSRQASSRYSKSHKGIHHRRRVKANS